MKETLIPMTACVLTATPPTWGTGARQAPKPTPPAERLVGMSYATWFPPLGWDRVWGTPKLDHYRSEKHGDLCLRIRKESVARSKQPDPLPP